MGNGFWLVWRILARAVECARGDICATGAVECARGDICGLIGVQRVPLNAHVGISVDSLCATGAVECARGDICGFISSLGFR